MNEWLEFSAWSIGTDLDEPPYFRDKNEECDEEIDEYCSDEIQNKKTVFRMRL